MFTVTTAEIRWFLRGYPESGLSEWLQGLNGIFEEQEPRDDLYLLFPGQEGLGIKLREGRLEFKKRLGVSRDHLLGPATGQVETWIKWSFQAATGIHSEGAQLEGSGHWITVSKKRYLQKYGIDPEGSLVLPPSGGYPEMGIVAELSGLQINGADWWTIGLECFGRAGEVQALLLANGDRILKDIPVTALHPANCMGYPEWIGMNIP